MIKRFTSITVAIGVLMGIGTVAANDLTFTPRPKGEASKKTQPTQPLTLSQSDCALLTQYITPPDVNYQPNQDYDSQGNPIVSADIGGGTYPIQVPDQVAMYVGIDLIKRYGVQPNLLTNQAIAGVVIWKDGQLFFNGRPLTSPDQNALALACRKAGF